MKIFLSIKIEKYSYSKSKYLHFLTCNLDTDLV